MGNKKNNIIEINGKRYDARTGEPLGHHSPVKVTVAHEPSPGHHTRPITIHHETHAPATAEPAPKADAHDIVRHPAKSAKAHSPQHSKTLMRSAVSKPPSSLKRHTKAHGHTDTLVKQPSLQLAPKPSASNLDERRLKHAAQVKRSQLVRRFNQSQSAVIVPVNVLKPVKPAAASKPIITAKPPAIEPKQPQTTADLLQHALQHATSHLQKPPKTHRKRRLPPKRITSISAVVFAVVVLAGSVVSSSITDLRLKVASAKAGFSASLPSDQPTGYHLGNLGYSPGTVALNFQSNSDQRKFTIVEKVSSWDSSTLRDNFVASSGQDYQAVESAGRTLYLYGRNAATWVSGGVWYQIEADGALSSNQLVKLASSM